MSNLETFDLTVKIQGALASEALAHLERGRWPEFECGLRKRRSVRFHVDGTIGAWPRWARPVMACRTLAEVERVLNHFSLDCKIIGEKRCRSMVCEERSIVPLK